MHVAGNRLCFSYFGAVKFINFRYCQKLGSRFYSMNLPSLAVKTKSNYSLHEDNRIIKKCWQASGLCTNDTLYIVQKRHFSVKESFESAVATHSSFFKSLSESTVVEKTQNWLIQFHDVTGLPWWLSVVSSTLLIRIVLTLPVAIYQNHIMARLENIKLEMDEIVNRIKYDLNHEVRKNRWSEKKARSYFNANVRKEWKTLIERDNCHPAKTLILALIQIPLWVVLSTSFRNIVYKLPHNDAFAEIKWLEMTVGGVAWFPNLTLADPLVIPVVLGLTNLAIIEVQTMLLKGKRSRLHKFGTNFFRAFSIFMIPVAANVPSCLALYWTTSSLYGLCQNLTLLSPTVRKLLRIPLSPSAHAQPYTHLAQQIKAKFGR